MARRTKPGYQALPAWCSSMMQGGGYKVHRGPGTLYPFSFLTFSTTRMLKLAVLFLGSSVVLPRVNVTEVVVAASELLIGTSTKGKLQSSPAEPDIVEGPNLVDKISASWASGSVGDETLSLLKEPKSEEENIQKETLDLRQDDKAEISIKVRQDTSNPVGTRWVELFVEVLGPDGKINREYGGGVASSLIFSDENDLGTSEEEHMGNKKQMATERAVQIASEVAVEGKLHAAGC